MAMHVSYGIDRGLSRVPRYGGESCHNTCCTPPSQEFLLISYYATIIAHSLGKVKYKI